MGTRAGRVCCFAVAVLPMIAFAGAKDIDGVDVIIKKKPKPVVVSKQRARPDGSFTVPPLPPGSYTVVMSFNDPQLSANSSGKSFFESRSNTAKRAAPAASRGAMLQSDWLTFDGYPYVYAIGGGAPAASPHAGIVRSGDHIEISHDIEILGPGVTINGSVRRELPPAPSLPASPVGGRYEVSRDPGRRSYSYVTLPQLIVEGQGPEFASARLTLAEEKGTELAQTTAAADGRFSLSIRRTDAKTKLCKQGQCVVLPAGALPAGNVKCVVARLDLPPRCAAVK